VRHVIVDRWSRGDSFLHRRDPRAKIIALLVFLVVLATTPPNAFWTLAADAAMLLMGIVAAKLPAGAVFARAAVTLPFSLIFAVVVYFAGDRMRALGLVEKSYLSGAAVLIVAASTPFPALLDGLDRLGSPRLLTVTVQFLYRYLFVIVEQAQRMRLAAACRQGLGGRNRVAFGAAAGAVSMLFARSYARAEGIHRAMLARGFSGHFTSAGNLRFGTADAAFALTAGMIAIAARMFA
jgi:cobalt/nickel transport system permease protein